MKITFEGTPSEIDDMLNKLSTVIEEEAVKAPEIITGYDVEQYDATNIGISYVETHEGFKIYKSGNYYRWWRNTDFEAKSNLEHDIAIVRQLINDHIIRLNR